ncbi:hypothetical protein [Kitasatospora sp. NPDC094015]|uniref:hypothetical protein n=1 Tax=Kitasatospora sp. NPDC094015 TaxID=3155205 RepID=UPI00332AFEA1
MDLGERLGRQEDGLDDLLAALGLTWPDEPDERVARLAQQQPHYPQYHRIGHKRQTVRRALEADRTAAARHFEPVLALLLLDDDPSSPRWLTTALVAAVGHRRVLAGLLHAAEEGTPDQRRCAANAWHWAEPPLRHASEQARREGRPTATSRAQREAVADLEQRFRAAIG